MSAVAWTRLLLVAATTFASKSTHPAPHSCAAKTSLQAACAASDAHVEPLHVLAPFAPPCAVLLFSHAPTLLLASNRRARRLHRAAAHAFALWAAVLGAAAVYLRLSPSFAYAVALHASATSLSARGSSSLFLLSPAVHAAARCLATAALVAGAAYAGPPLPVFDAPGVPGCCGAAAHLAAWAGAETLGAAVVPWLLGQGFDE
jgi:hypothetical protein